MQIIAANKTELSDFRQGFATLRTLLANDKYHYEVLIFPNRKERKGKEGFKERFDFK